MLPADAWGQHFAPNAPSPALPHAPSHSSIHQQIHSHQPHTHSNLLGPEALIPGQPSSIINSTEAQASSQHHRTGQPSSQHWRTSTPAHHQELFLPHAGLQEAASQQQQPPQRSLYINPPGNVLAHAYQHPSHAHQQSHPGQHDPRQQLHRHQQTSALIAPPGPLSSPAQHHQQAHGQQQRLSTLPPFLFSPALSSTLPPAQQSLHPVQPHHQAQAQAHPPAQSHQQASEQTQLHHQAHPQARAHLHAQKLVQQHGRVQTHTHTQTQASAAPRGLDPLAPSAAALQQQQQPHQPQRPQQLQPQQQQHHPEQQQPQQNIQLPRQQEQQQQQQQQQQSSLPPQRDNSYSASGHQGIQQSSLLRGHAERGPSQPAHGDPDGNEDDDESVDDTVDPETEAFQCQMVEILAKYGPKPDESDARNAKSNNVTARAAWIRGFIKAQVQMMAVDFKISEAVCRRTILPGAGSVDIRKSGLQNKWRHWRVQTNREANKKATESKKEHTAVAYERWNKFKHDPSRSEEENQFWAKEEEADIRAMRAWYKDRVVKHEVTSAEAALDDLNDKLSSLAVTANDLHGINMVAFVAHAEGNLPAAVTGTDHSRRVFKMAVKRIKNQNYSAASVCNGFWALTVAHPTWSYLRPGTRITSGVDAIKHVSADDIAEDTDISWAICHGVLTNRLFRVADKAVTKICASRRSTPEQVEAEKEWVQMNKQRTKLPFKNLFTFLSRLGLKVTGWPAVARSLLNADDGTLVIEKRVLEASSADADPDADPDADLNLSTNGATTIINDTRTKRKKGRKKKLNVPPPPAEAAPATHDFTVLEGTLKYTRDWPRPESRLFLGLLLRDNDLVKVIPVDSVPPQGSLGETQSPTSRATDPENAEISQETSAGGASGSGLNQANRVGFEPLDHDTDESCDDDGSDLPNARQAHAASNRRKRQRTATADEDDFSSESELGHRVRAPARTAVQNRRPASRRHELPSWTRDPAGQSSTGDADDEPMEVYNRGPSSVATSGPRPSARPVG
ncbi:hypothetical protein V8E36_003337 [Tilletia maclaganii]